MGSLLCHHKDKDDGWKQQNKEMVENPAYKFANLARGGSLIDAYNEQGPLKVKSMAENEMSKFFYHEDGKAHTISREEFIAWQRRYMRRVAGLDDEKVSDEEILADYEEHHFNKVGPHEACWDLNKRGGVGETPFHLLYLMDSPVHFEVAKILLKMYPNLSLDVYEGEEYYGESALHIAIVVGDFDSVQLLVEAGAKVNQRATGRFFLPEDQKKGPSENTNYAGYAYYGEYPLAFAACLGNKDMYDYLLEHGADPNLQDSFGNTVLHMVVIADRSDMYRYAVRHHKIRAITNIKNKQNLSPLTLACKLGRHSIFREMLDLDSIELWRFSTTMCSVHPLSTLDSIGPDGSTNWNSALMIIVNGEEEDHLEMLEGGVMRQLLIEKWKTFARQRFIIRLIFATIHLVLFSVAIYTRPEGNSLLSYNGPVDAVRNLVRFTSEIVVCLSCVATVSYEVMEISTQGMRTFFKNLTHAPAQTVYLLSCLLVLACVPFRILRRPDIEDILLTLAAPCSWFFLLFFARGHILTGPFVTMIYKMCAGDLFRFAIIYIIFLFGFTQDFYFLFRDVDPPSPNDNSEDGQDVKQFYTLVDTTLYLFQMTLGEFKYGVFGKAHYAPLTKIVFALFMILVPILLLNMLIAMMGNTYTQVISKSTKEWWKQWAKIVIVLERGISKKKLIEYQKSYSVKLAGKPPPNDGSPPPPDERALVVIKLCEKSRAKRRKGAVLRWKMFGKEIIRQRKMWQKKNNESQPFALSQSMTKGQLEDDNALSSTVAQLAWEKDIDLTKGHPFVADADYITPRSPSLNSPTHRYSPVHLGNGSASFYNNTSGSELKEIPSVQITLGPVKKKSYLVYNRVAPLFSPRTDQEETTFSDISDGINARLGPENVDFSPPEYPGGHQSSQQASLLQNNSDPSWQDGAVELSRWADKTSDIEPLQISIKRKLAKHQDRKSQFTFTNPLAMGRNASDLGLDNDRESQASSQTGQMIPDSCWTEESIPNTRKNKVKRKLKKSKVRSKKKHQETKGSNSSSLTLIDSGGSSKA
ncbi:unnamed protein product [Lymnaea stagnalis]|uniref:Ion transport domain-containing protein n=1 Tax=Lymnaea stagnalis TaxID=6523 RepID=A0AAV2HFF5_LYMST